MPRISGHSGFSLAIIGIACMAFFWLTDPRALLGRWLVGDGVDAVNQSHLGTQVGIAGCAAALLIGLWLMTRRTS